MRIMIVEDENRARRGLHNLITSISEEYEVVSNVPDGRRALEIITSVKPEVIFTDVKMPYMDGISLIKAVRSLGIKSEFVIISAYEQFEVARQAISLGVREFLVKPVTYEEVESVLERLNSKDLQKSGEVTTDLVKQYPEAHPMVLKALKIIENMYTTKISEETIAEQLGMTKEYFSYLFHKDIGITFSKYLRKYRIEIAKTLLVNEGLPKEEIPYSVGFSDPKYFNKVFREIQGESISEYIRRTRN
jgi:Response regulator containing CheY-like receiver domain and AraC-type DNA-binding domain